MTTKSARQPAIQQPEENQSNAGHAARQDLESAIFCACALINLLSSKLAEVLDRDDTEGPASGEIAYGIVALSGDTVKTLREAYEAEGMIYRKALFGSMTCQPES